MTSTPPASTPSKSPKLRIVWGGALIAFGILLLFRATGSGSPDNSGITVYLVDGEQKPIACSSTLWRVEAGSSHADEEASQACVEGRLTWSGLDHGEYRLVVQSPGKERLEQRVAVSFSEVDLGTRTLSEGLRVEGRVVMGEEPVSGALVLVEGGRRVHSDTEGRFALDGLPRKDLEFRAAAEGGRGSATFQLGDESGESVLVIALERGRGQGLLGLKFELRGGGPVVTDLLPNSPAAKKLEFGDRILMVDGVSLSQLDSSEIAQVLAGEAGSVASLQVERAGEPWGVELARIAPHALTGTVVEAPQDAENSNE